MISEQEMVGYVPCHVLSLPFPSSPFLTVHEQQTTHKAHEEAVCEVHDKAAHEVAHEVQEEAVCEVHDGAAHEVHEEAVREVQDKVTHEVVHEVHEEAVHEVQAEAAHEVTHKVQGEAVHEVQAEAVCGDQEEVLMNSGRSSSGPHQDIWEILSKNLKKSVRQLK